MEQINVGKESFLNQRNEVDVLADSLDEAIKSVQEGRAEYATTFPVREWDEVSFEESPEVGVFYIRVAGNPDIIGATKSPENFPFGQKKAS